MWIKKKVKATYSLKILDGSLAVINNKTKEVFEYTDMKKENLPADILNMLKALVFLLKAFYTVFY